MVYHVILAEPESPEYFTCDERELRDILVYFILDKYEDYDKNVLDECVLRVYDDVDIKTMIERASKRGSKDVSYDKTYIVAVINGGETIYSHV